MDSKHIERRRGRPAAERREHLRELERQWLELPSRADHDPSAHGPNYNVAFRLGYEASPHWYIEGFATGNNARNYASRAVGITLRVFTERVPVTDLRVKTIPDWRGRSLAGF